MSENFINPPWWQFSSSDYTRSRSTGVDYTIDDLIGRKDYKKYTLTTTSVATVSGTEGTILV